MLGSFAGGRMKADEKKCPDCAEVIKRDASVCKHCGHRFTSEEVAAGRRRVEMRKWGCGAAVLGVVVLIFIAAHSTPNADTSSPSNGAASSGDSPGSNSAEAAPASKWTYDEQRDDMRNRTDKFAQLQSENEQDFSFPYNGGSHLSIALQKFRKPETEVMLKLEKGQFICHSFTGGSVSVRFDGGPVRKFGCSDTSDADTSTIFLHPAGAFLTALRKSSKVTVEAEFFQEGVRQFSFDTRGLKWQ